MQAKKPKPAAQRLRLRVKKAKNYGTTVPPDFTVVNKKDIEQLERRLNDKIITLCAQIEGMESHICGYLQHGFSDLRDTFEDFSSRLPDSTFEQYPFFNQKPDRPLQWRN